MACSILSSFLFLLSNEVARDFSFWDSMNWILLRSRSSSSSLRFFASSSLTASFLFISCSWKFYFNLRASSFLVWSSYLLFSFSLNFFSAYSALLPNRIALYAWTCYSFSAFCLLNISSFSFLTACAANFLSRSNYRLFSFSCCLIIFYSFLAFIKFIFISRSIIWLTSFLCLSFIFCIAFISCSIIAECLTFTEGDGDGLTPSKSVLFF